MVLFAPQRAPETRSVCQTSELKLEENNVRTTYMAKPGEVERKWYVVDATDVPLGRLSTVVASVLAGGAGHSRQIALRLDGAKGGRLVSLDQDPDAVQTARARLAGLPATVVQINFRYAGQADNKKYARIRAKESRGTRG